MATYDSLYDSIKAIVTKNALDTYIEGFTPELINILLSNHLDKIKECTDYNATQIFINNTLSAKIGVGICDFIPMESERNELYQYMAKWREIYLAEVETKK